MSVDQLVLKIKTFLIRKCYLTFKTEVHLKQTNRNNISLLEHFIVSHMRDKNNEIWTTLHARRGRSFQQKRIPSINKENNDSPCLRQMIDSERVKKRNDSLFKFSRRSIFSFVVFRFVSICNLSVCSFQKNGVFFSSVKVFGKFLFIRDGRWIFSFKEPWNRVCNV